MTKQEKIKDLKTNIQKHSDKIDKEVKVKRELQGLLAELICPFSVSDIVGNGNKTFIIDELKMYDLHRVELRGRQIRMNGEPYDKDSDMIWPYLTKPERFTLIEKGK